MLMSEDLNKLVIQRYYDEMWNRWNFALADELLCKDIFFRGSLGAEMCGRAAFCDYMLRVQTAFPDFNNKIEQLVAEGDQVVARLQYTGTHQGEIFSIPPSGKLISYAGAAFFRIVEGRAQKAGFEGTSSVCCGNWGYGRFPP
jgi:steroid delta-isomerase-like uncharacterized protein